MMEDELEMFQKEAQGTKHKANWHILLVRVMFKKYLLSTHVLNIFYTEKFFFFFSYFRFRIYHWNFWFLSFYVQEQVL